MADPSIRLVVNADDFGMTPVISRGIIKAHREGIVTSTSLLGNCADLPAAAALLAAAPELGVGIHLSLIGGRPVSSPGALASLTDTSGAFLPRAVDFFTRWIKGNIQLTEIQTEFDAQIERIRAVGIVPDHLDTHHHLGFLPLVGKAMEAAARRHGIPGVRALLEKPTLSWIAEPKRGLEAGLLTGLSWLARRQMGSHRHGPRSWGIVESGQLDEVRILEIAGRLEPGDHELICHPAESDQPDHPSGDAGAQRYHRAAELAALTSTRVRDIFARRGIVRCRWKDLF
jgi:predicted glycoside hydrolase/deacetylase ChbG (UPF0249 family)